MADRDYTVTAQRQDRGYNAARQIVDVIEVSWEGPNGITGQVSIPMDSYTAENVDQAIRRQLGERIRVANLGAGG